MLNNSNFYPVCLFTRKYIECLPDFDKSYSYSSNKAKGLCNQLFSLINGIIEAIKFNKNFIVIDSFLTCIYTNRVFKISDIIDLKKTTKNLLENNIKIYLIDRTNINFKFISVKYGLNNDKNIDITNKFNSFKNNFLISKTQNFNEVIELDPYPNLSKKLFISYSLDNHVISEIIKENKTKLANTICFKNNIVQKSMWFNKTTNFGWYNKYNVELFNKILSLIVFNQNFYNLVDEYENIYNISNNNIVHYRIEDDAILHWSKQNNMELNKFKNQLIDKYNKLLNSYLDKDIPIYLLTNNRNVEIIEFNITKIDNKLAKNYIKHSGREISALIDLLLASSSSQIFIGCHNLKLNRGSSFSYVIHHLGKFKKKLFIDLDDITLDLKNVYFNK